MELDYDWDAVCIKKQASTSMRSNVISKPYLGRFGALFVGLHKSTRLVIVGFEPRAWGYLRLVQGLSCFDSFFEPAEREYGGGSIFII